VHNSTSAHFRRHQLKSSAITFKQNCRWQSITSVQPQWKNDNEIRYIYTRWRDYKFQRLSMIPTKRSSSITKACAITAPVMSARHQHSASGKYSDIAPFYAQRQFITNVGRNFQWKWEKMDKARKRFLPGQDHETENCVTRIQDERSPRNCIYRNTAGLLLTRNKSNSQWCPWRNDDIQAAR